MREATPDTQGGRRSARTRPNAKGSLEQFEDKTAEIEAKKLAAKKTTVEGIPDDTPHNPFAPTPNKRAARMTKVLLLYNLSCSNFF